MLSYKSMKARVLILIFAAMIGLTSPAGAETAPEGREKHPVLNALVGKGAEVVKNRLDKRRENKEAEAEGKKDRGRLSLPGVAGSLQGAMWHTVTEKLGEKVATVLERYKAEGKEYAKQLGNQVAQRVLADEKVQRTMLRIKLVVWMLAIYLVGITITLLCKMRALKKGQLEIKELLEQVRRLQS